MSSTVWENPDLLYSRLCQYSQDNVNNAPSSSFKIWLTFWACLPAGDADSHSSIKLGRILEQASAKSWPAPWINMLQTEHNRADSMLTAWAHTQVRGGLCEHSPFPARWCDLSRGSERLIILFKKTQACDSPHNDTQLQKQFATKLPQVHA